MLLKVIQQLIKSQGLNKEAETLLTRSIYRYVLKLSAAKELKQVGAKLKVTTALMEFKRVYLNNSHYVLSRLWRAVYSYYYKEQEYCDRCIHCDKCLEELGCDKFEWDILALAEEHMVDPIDIQYIIDHAIITPEDQEKLDTRKDVLNPPNPQIINKIILKSLSYIKYIVHKRLSFIFKYNNMDPQDFINDLTAWVLSHLNDNDYIEDEDQLMKIANTSVNQITVNIIAQYTAKKRSRLTSTEKGYKSTLISLEVSDYMRKADNRTSLDEEALLKRILPNINEEELYFLKETLAGRAKGDILSKLNWSRKRVVHFKDKVKNLLDRCTI